MTEYYGRWVQLRGGWGGLPAWGRLLVGLAAFPGLLLLGLSILVFLVSLLALCILALPVYGLLSAVCRPVRADRASGSQGSARKAVEATVIE